jgi:ATP-dependent DNA ligase
VGARVRSTPEIARAGIATSVAPALPYGPTWSTKSFPYPRFCLQAAERQIRSVKRRAGFIEPMLLLPSAELPEGPEWLRELKVDGYRAVAFKSAGKVHLRSRNDNDFNLRYPAIVTALSDMPDETVIDGEVVALDHSGRHRSTSSRTTARRKHRSFITCSI